ncbi:MAG: hypothetical protein EAZ25_01915 [Oscillatoriales cyanobacterium]|nr:MAG: hypothetical protein EAZ25_01915 [Oscillatoriales cyanobacterium]
MDTVKDGNRTLADYDYDKVGNLIQSRNNKRPGRVAKQKTRKNRRRTNQSRLQ